MAAPGDGEEKKAGSRKNKHGLPRGFRFVPQDQELLDILDDKLRGAPLDRALDAVFHDTRILDFHPAKLYGIHRLSIPGSLSLSSFFFFSGDGLGALGDLIYIIHQSLHGIQHKSSQPIRK
uniref:NAC domain-containing protein n=1 Tax=Oryza meridionalis TaxID=40149 RepID=A0A0E0EXU1_9ORYZ